MRRALVISVASVALATLAGTASADRRLFTRLYHYSTMSEGKTALELWHTQSQAVHWPLGIEQRFGQTIEIEHGITDRLDVGFVATFEQLTTDLTHGLRLDQSALEMRYRFVERTEWPIDVMLHLAAGKQFGRTNYPCEVRAIISRDFDRLTLGGNLVVELGFGGERESTEPDSSREPRADPARFLGGAVGATYLVHNKIELGVEGWGSRRRGEGYITIGPVASFALTERFWTTVGVGFGITNLADDYAVRAIFGLEL